MKYYRSIRSAVSITLACAAALVFAHARSAAAASNLRLSPGLSFDDDSSPSFPIEGENLADGSVRTGEAAVIFFGTSNCWNTAREAERLVKLYPQFRNRLHFVIVNLRSVTPEQQTLVNRYYHGYIPTIAIVDSQGRLIYDRAGETAARRRDTNRLRRLLDSAHWQTGKRSEADYSGNIRV